MSPQRRARVAVLLLPGAVAFSAARPLTAQDPPEEPFVEAAIRSSARFAELDVAIAEGYRKLGPDFPGMGEHWINPSLVIAGKLDPARPPVLCYARVEGRRQWVGLAYTQVLAPGETPREGPFPAGAWHDHTGDVDEESLLLAGPASLHAVPSGFRLAMVHVWSPQRNAQGLLTQNNWALPFLRAGVAVPEQPSVQAARALSTHGEGLSFYQGLLQAGLELEGRDLHVAMSAFRDASERADAWVQASRADPRGPLDVSELATIWDDLWKRLEESLPAPVFERLGILRAPGPM